MVKCLNIGKPIYRSISTFYAILLIDPERRRTVCVLVVSMYLIAPVVHYGDVIGVSFIWV